MATPLENARFLRDQGMLDQLTPIQKAKALKLLEPEMAAERAQALQTKGDLEATPPENRGFVHRMAEIAGDIATPAVTSAQNPLTAAYNVGRGIERSMIPFDLETLDIAMNFPVIRGAELAARLFVPEKDRPALTTFAQLVNDQRDLDTKLRQITPGVQEGTEMGMVAASAVQLARTAAKKAPQAMRKVAQYIQQTKAAGAQKKAQRLSQELLRLGKGSPFTEAILRDPDGVAQLVKESGDLTINDVTVRLKDELEGITKHLANNVAEFRTAAFDDTVSRIAVPDEVVANIAMLRRRTTLADTGRETGKAISMTERLSPASQGAQSVLPPELNRKLSAIERMAGLGVTTPNQAMVWVDTLDDVIEYGQSGKIGSNIVRNANNTLMAIRGSLKNALRAQSPKAAEWAAADDAFSGFVEASHGLVTRLNTDSADSLVANLFTKNKTPLRARLESALDYMERIDPTAVGNGEAFFSRLAKVKAAERIRDVQIQINDPIQDNMNRIVSTWRRRGQQVGRGVGVAVGGAPGYVMGRGNMVSGIGAGSGYFLGEAVGGLVGEAVGKRIADPMRVIKAAQKSKLLSQKARALAGDMGYVVQKFGPEGGIAFLDLVGPIPAVNELIKFANSGENQKREGGK